MDEVENTTEENESMLWASCQTDTNTFVQGNGSTDPKESTLPEEGNDNFVETKESEQMEKPADQIGVDQKHSIKIEIFETTESTFEEKNNDFNEIADSKINLPIKWVIEKFLCRCCHSEGDFDTRLHMKSDEDEGASYEDMLWNCFNIQLSPVRGAERSSLCALCALCAARLRDAHAFRRQVRAAETRFVKFYSDNCIEVPLAETIEENAKVLPDVSEDCGANSDDSSSDKELLVKHIEKTKEEKQKKETTQEIIKKTKPRGATLVTTENCTRVGDTYKCTTCEKGFHIYRNFYDHYRKVHIRKKIDCKICNETFKTQTQLTAHKLEIHNIDERHKCNACDKLFNQKKQLLRHNLSYHKLGEKKKCNLCDYETFYKHNMNEHILYKHNTLKDFHCKYCNKAFKKKSGLNLHERIHTGDKRKACVECGQAFVQKASLNYHMTRYHPGVQFQ